MNVTKNLVLGVMGKVGSGKSTVIKIISDKYNTVSFSADEVFKEMQENGEFGDNIEINTKLFLDTKLQEKIREEYHPKVFDKIKKNIDKIKKSDKEYDFILVETALPSDKYLMMCDKTIYVENSDKIKSMRLMDGRNYTSTKIKNILDSQKYYEKYYKKADYKINNDTDKTDLIYKIDFVIKEMRGQI